LLEINKIPTDAIYCKDMFLKKILGFRHVSTICVSFSVRAFYCLYKVQIINTYSKSKFY